MTMSEPRLEEFVANLRRSGLLDPPTVDAYVETLVGVTSARHAISLFVRDGVLTPFQCRLLAEGKYRGFLVNAKYKILELIAVGGMGAVYLCEHMLMRRLVAMKVLPRETSATPGSVERFLREARAVAALDHPNLVRAFDVDRLGNGNNHCLVLEFVDGVSLHQLVEKHGRQPVDRAVGAIVQAAEGLHYAHQAGLIHRDVKPSNVLLSRSGTVKILDLGLARFFDDKADNLTRQHGENAILGTADFIAPEQAMNAPIDTRADVYSLGCTLYYLLTGRPPFPDGSATNKMLWHQTRDPDPIADLVPNIPQGLVDVIGRMMAKSPDNRYASMVDAADALQPFCTSPIAPPSSAEVPALCPAVRKLMSDLPKAGQQPPRSSKTRASVSESLAPAASDSENPSLTSGAHRDATIDLTDIPTWRGRPLVDQSSATSQTTGDATPRPAVLKRETHSAPTSATHGNARLFNLFVGGFIGLALIVGALVAYQVNKPPAIAAPSSRP